MYGISCKGKKFKEGLAANYKRPHAACPSADLQERLSLCGTFKPNGHTRLQLKYRNPLCPDSLQPGWHSSLTTTRFSNSKRLIRRIQVTMLGSSTKELQQVFNRYLFCLYVCLFVCFASDAKISYNL